ncbi:conserved hypothetical protein [Aspergillus udagawae]|uniref:Uncharacterized protein n=1 Tax=Aspergillus udagawae TaxID=91492 RepID=A0ABQ1AIW0_9EURO|nr:conserved hypothetical protein [Aspergillus udagawae]
MEGCVPLTTGPISSLIVLFSLLLGLFILFRRLDAVILAMAQASQPSETFCSLANKETQHEENNTNTKNNDNTTAENASPKSFSLGPVYSEKTAVVVLNPQKCSNILDSHLDDIRVPTLQPKTPQKRIHLAVTDPNQLRTVSLQRTASDVLLDAGIEDLMIPVLEPERKPLVVARVRKNSDVPKLYRSGMDTVPWEGNIRWAIKGCSIFENQQEEADAFSYRPNLLSRQSVSDLWIFQYGLRYIPAGRESNVFRTVRIEKLASNVTLSQVLPSVPGEIYSASLCNTSPITRYNTSIIVFVFERDALDFVRKSKEGLPLGFCVANVALVHTPTYPMTSQMSQYTFHQGYTRCLVISNLRRSLREEIYRVLKRSAYYNYIESVEEGQVVGDIYVRFYSITMAAAAYDLFQGHPSFERCSIRFLRKAAE